MDAGVLSSGSELVRPFVAAGLTDGAARCLERFARWGAAPTVDAYCALFAEGGTLLDADMVAPVGGEAIRESIVGVLALLPDFRFAPVGVVAEASQVFVRAANRGTLGDRPLAWEAIYALTIEGDRIAAGRRYYDRAALVSGVHAFASAVPRDDVGTDGPLPRPAGAAAVDLEARADAWNRRDAAILVEQLPEARLHMAGVGRHLDAPASKRAALAALLARAGGLRLAPGAVARSPTGIAIEWVGTVGTEPRRFALVEIVDALPGSLGWHLVFDTSGFQEGS